MEIHTPFKIFGRWLPSQKPHSELFSSQKPNIMKPITTLLFLFLIYNNGSLVAQDLSALDTVVHYTLINTTTDKQGNYTEVELINSPFEDADGVYCNGIYLGNDPDGCLVRTPPLTELYDSSFAAQVEFRIDSIPSTLAPIIICGGSWRYLGMTVSFTGNIMYVINNTTYMVDSFSVSPNQWHTATCVYNSIDSTATFWMDGQQIGSRTEALERSDNDNRISNSNSGSGHTFLGNLRNLIFMSGKGVISATRQISIEEAGHIYPNPSSSELNVADVSFSSWKIYSMSGNLMISGKSNQNEKIDVSRLAAGTYILLLQDEKNSPVSRHPFQKI